MEVSTQTLKGKSCRVEKNDSSTMTETDKHATDIIFAIEYVEKIQLELLNEKKQKEQLQKDMEHLNKKYIDIVDNVTQVTSEKEKLESEIEDLTKQLFISANELVAKEAQRRQKAEADMVKLKQVVNNLHEMLGDKGDELVELKTRMQTWGDKMDFIEQENCRRTSY